MDENVSRPSGALGMQGNGQRFGVSRWTTWEGGTDGTRAPDLAFVPAMLRRRLSRLSALAISVASRCLDQDADVPLVFASQHGELARTADLLAAIARREPVSPAAFSLSVHNSAAGLLTLVRKERASATAIAAGRLTVAMGLLEAASQAHERGGPVLLVCADVQPCETYDEVVHDATEYAFAALITPDSRNWLLESMPAGSAAGTPGTQAGQLLAVFGGECDASVLGDAEHAWQVRHA